ncbi:MAG: hypothetical protein NTZ78_06930 [Candidatus Aureabacteria bacterium]|nr:hypothetical protein [Candidatus Auribacterota bacterium]
MSTILRALKKAEESRARETLPGKIFPDESASVRWGVRMPLLVGGFCSVCVCVAVIVLLHLRNQGTQLPVNPGTASARRVSEPIPQGSAAGAPETPVPLPPKLRLSGILWDESQPLAIINGKPSRTGAEIDGATVVRIDRNDVQVRWKEKIITLSVE